MHLPSEPGLPEPGTDDMAEHNLRGLLRSMDASAQEMALALMQVVPPGKGLLTDFMALFLFSDRMGIRHQSEALFRRLAPRDLQWALADDLSVKKFASNKMGTWLRRLRQRQEIDGAVLSHYLYAYQLIGLPEYLQYGAEASFHSLESRVVEGKLDLSGEQLRRTPEEVVSLTGVRELDLSRNQLPQLGGLSGKLPELRVLVADHNKIAEISTTIGQASGLEVLSLAFNQLESLPGGFAHLGKLRRLDLTHNRFAAFPELLLELEQLEELDLAENEIDHMPSLEEGGDKLRILRLSGNGLKALPDGIGRMKSLEVVDFSGNPLGNLPDSVVAWQGIRELNCQQTNLKALPEGVGAWTRLETLRLRDAQLRELPEEIGMCGNLQWLDLAYNRLASVPETVGDLSHLQWLDLEGNLIAHLPNSLHQLNGLRHLNLAGNGLREFAGGPEGIEFLDLSENPLGEIHWEAATGSRLHTLRLRGCPVQRVTGWGNLARLTHLDLQGVKPVAWPGDWSELPQLTDLSLGPVPFHQLRERLSGFAAARGLQRCRIVMRKLYPQRQRTEVEEALPRCQFTWETL